MTQVSVLERMVDWQPEAVESVNLCLRAIEARLGALVDLGEVRASHASALGRAQVESLDKLTQTLEREARSRHSSVARNNGRTRATFGGEFDAFDLQPYERGGGAGERRGGEDGDGDGDVRGRGWRGTWDGRGWGVDGMGRDGTGEWVSRRRQKKGEEGAMTIHREKSTPSAGHLLRPVLGGLLEPIGTTELPRSKSHPEPLVRVSRHVRWTDEEAARVVVGVLAEKTGFTTEMIEMCQDLEQDLAIDSIKRVEILSEVQHKFNFDSYDAEALARTKTVGEMVNILIQHLENR